MYFHFVQFYNKEYKATISVLLVMHHISSSHRSSLLFVFSSCFCTYSLRDASSSGIVGASCMHCCFIVYPQGFDDVYVGGTWWWWWWKGQTFTNSSFSTIVYFEFILGIIILLKKSSSIHLQSCR